MKLPRQVRRRTPARHTHVRNALGVKLKCCWDDCESSGYDDIKVIVTEQAGTQYEKRLHYVFCSERHKQLHLNSHHNNGKLL